MPKIQRQRTMNQLEFYAINIPPIEWDKLSGVDCPTDERKSVKHKSDNVTFAFIQNMSGEYECGDISYRLRKLIL